ncbi:restriction endonuclease subunit S [Nocardia nova]|uniref:Restriction endonuclease subunit S n=1 Tax=Nocardia nova TaxID=37330 RepID=A0A2S6AME1_9NOCA|nr:restriction endonuclease subunit S [Nocardia nova]PPJ36388.1 restriction endonuclease subunit S [Nocardia nova]
MSGWPLVALGDVLVQDGQTEHIVDTESEKFLTIKLYGNGLVERVIGSGKTPKPFVGYRIKSGQFVYSRIDARNGAYGVVPAELDGAVCSKDFPKFDVDELRADKSYLLRLVQTREFYRKVQDLSFGATNRQRVKEGEFLRLQIPLPPIAEQRRIAAILDHADTLRAKRREALARLDELTQSIFIDMFGDPTTNPFGWETVACRELCLRLTVGIVVKPASYYQESGVPTLRSLNVRPNRVDLNNLVFISEEDNVGRLAKSRVFADDVVLVRSGQPGAAAVIPPELDGANAVDIIIASPDPKRVSPEYLARYFNSEGGRRMTMGESRGQIQQHLNIKSVAAAGVPLPPISRQLAFAERIAETSALVAAHRTALNELDALFTSLQSCAFRGEL